MQEKGEMRWEEVIPRQAELSQWEKVRIYADVFNSDNGRFVLYDMDVSYGKRSSYFPEKDAVQMAFNEGERSAYLKILALVNAAKHPEWFEDA